MKNKSWILSSVAVIFFTLAYVIWQFLYDGNGFNTSEALGLKALEHVQEVTKWMAAIQMAMLSAAVAILANKNITIHPFSGPTTVVFLIASLFSASWVFTGVPSIAMRLHECNVKCDGLNYSLYEQLPSFLDLNFFLTLQHWFWAFSLVAFLHMLWVTFGEKTA